MRNAYLSLISQKVVFLSLAALTATAAPPQTFPEGKIIGKVTSVKKWNISLVRETFNISNSKILSLRLNSTADSPVSSFSLSLPSNTP